jgi:hypothetical protein
VSPPKHLLNARGCRLLLTGREGENLSYTTGLLKHRRKSCDHVRSELVGFPLITHLEVRFSA